jgi:hypothetical protein
VGRSDTIYVGWRIEIRALESPSLINDIERRFSSEISAEIIAEELVDLARSVL